jgi:hypothetical protein
LLKVWAIQHTTSGNYLPFSKVKKGFSYDEPSTKTRPRLFYSYRAAKQALNAWLKGHWKVRMSTERESWEIPHEYLVFDGFDIQEVKYRKTLVMRIVEFNLVDVAPLEG